MTTMIMFPQRRKTPLSLSMSLSLLLVALSLTLHAAHSTTTKTKTTTTTTTTTNKLDPNLQYITYPLREESKAAIVEWGNSAIISALDAAVADFGVPTSHSAFFEVEASPILADPVDGRGGKPIIDDSGGSGSGGSSNNQYNVPYPGPLDNADEVRGNLLVMTNQANMSGVTMAKIAKESGAAALMVVNVDQETPDIIYSMAIETEEERLYAEEEIDFPVVMVSLASGNLITTATVEEGMEEEDIVNNGMPERIRLYAAGDRPFFEDVSSQSPVLYLIHNLMSVEECEALIGQSEHKLELVDDSISNLLEYAVGEPTSTGDGKKTKSKSVNIERTVVWKGQINSHAGKLVEERIEQVTGYPQDQFSDWIVTRHSVGSRHELHYDHHPIYPPVATITVFLNDLEGNDNDNEDDAGAGAGAGGEIVYPNPVEGSPVMIEPRRGLAVVHHNTDYDGNVDYAAVYGEMTLRGNKGKDKGQGTVKYVAKKYVYAQPLPPSKRLLLPLLAVPTGGKLPRWAIYVHDFCLSTFGLEKGTEYFDKLCTMFPVAVLFVIGAILQRIFQNKLSSLEHPPSSSSSSSSGSGNSDSAKNKKSNGGKKKGKKNKKLE